jgi:nucleoside-diphosphate-sugar epimerase
MTNVNSRVPFTILGANGFIGSHLVSFLNSKGCICYAPSKGDDELFNRPLGHVIYCIGLTADFRRYPLATVEAHVCFLKKLLERADFTSLLYLSSTRVYQGNVKTQEDEPLHVFPDADGLYNLTKLTGEALCLQTGKGKVARLSNIVGDGASESFLAQLMAEAATGNVQLRSSPESAKDYLLIDDAIQALAALACHNVGGIYNVAFGKNTTTTDILAALKNCFSFSTTVIETAPRNTYPVISTSKLSRLFPWHPQEVTTWLRNKHIPISQRDYS